ncbi:MAG TPA: amidohydrolase family protein, partial [Actinophytocola sp.]|nr:amidohydrolase family protein [Actinophytocola sp.]
MGHRRVSRRNVLRAGAVAAAATAGTGLAATPAAAHGGEPERLALVNGRIHTLDDRSRVVSSVLIQGGRFAAVGHGVPSHGPGLRVINLRGRTVVPGIVESHIHSVSLANRPGYHTILENTASIEEVQEALAARRRGVPEGAWITSMGGFHTNQWSEHRMPTLAELDEAVPDRPVLLYTRFTGPCATNTLGK